VRINGSYFQIIGVSKSKHTGKWGENQDTEILIPFSTAQQIYNYPNKVDHFSIVVQPQFEVAPVQEKVMAILAENHDLHPEDRGAFGYNDVSEDFKKITGLFLGVKILIWIVGIGTLMAGVIGVSNIMLIIIRERTKEFGIKRALGATPQMIIMNVLSESIFLTTMAGITGLMVGVVALGGMNKVFEGDPEAAIVNANIDFNLALTALGIIIFSGLIAGLIPSKKAVSIKPIEAIRTEN
jgi:putative ABC transport system permease protein